MVQMFIKIIPPCHSIIMKLKNKKKTKNKFVSFTDMYIG